MSYTIDLVRVEHLKLFALELEKTVIINFVYTLSSANIDLSAPNLAKICLTIRSQVSSIMNPLGLKQP